MTSKRELKNYKRDRIEKCTFALNDFTKTKGNFNDRLTSIIKTQNATLREDTEMSDIMTRLLDENHDLNMLLNLHTDSILKYTREHSQSIVEYFVVVQKILDTETGDPQRDSIHLDTITEAFDKTSDKKFSLEKAISSEIYKKSYYYRFINYFNGKVKFHKK